MIFFLQISKMKYFKSETVRQTGIYFPSSQVSNYFNLNWETFYARDH